MMYKENFAAAIKVNGKILREFGDTVYLPFGSEYQIRLKNLNSTRAKVKIEIDGQEVTDNGLVLNPIETFDLERFIRNGNHSEGNRFKFIERTSKIEDHRGIEVEDGIISISYEFEIPQPMLNTPIKQPNTYWGDPTYGSRKIDTPYETPTDWYSNTSQEMERLRVKCGYTNNNPIHDGQASFGSSSSGGRYTSNSMPRRIQPGETQYNPFVGTTYDSYVNSTDSVIPANDTGITVEGSKSNQSFGTTLWRGSIGGTKVMNIRLLGETEQNKAIREPVTVKTKLKCKTCGTMNTSTSKFCSECGTSLQIV